ALKEKLTTAPVLAYPNFSQEFLLFTDTSGIALVTEQECLAIVWSVSHFRQYLQGTHFIVITDHSALKSLLRHKLHHRRLARWILALQEYTFTVVHRAGKSYSNADSLSRIAESSTTKPANF
ncbi:5428_t:CDS:2, partial [Racocetra persica]